MRGIEIGSVSVGVSIGPTVNEGPVRGSLEGFRPMNITDIKPVDKGGTVAPLGEIVFNSAVPSGVLQAEQVAAAAWKNSEITKPEVVLPDLHEATLPNISTKPGTRLQPSPSTGSQTEAVYAPALQEQLVEEVVRKEETKTEDRTDELSEVREEAEVEELRLKYVEDEPVSRQRKYELREAIKKAKAEAQEQGAEEIEGWRIKKYFVPEHAGNRSGIAEPGIADGSLVETYQEISEGNYVSVAEAVEKADATVDDKKPVTRAKQGKAVKEIDIARVRRDPFLKSHPTEEVVARVVKKKILAEKLGQKPVVIHEVQTESVEPTLEEIHPDLAEVFQKAA